MSLGANRDYKTTDRRARKNLSIHKQLMDEFVAKGLGRDEASKAAYEVMVGQLDNVHRAAILEARKQR